MSEKFPGPGIKGGFVPPEFNPGAGPGAHPGFTPAAGPAGMSPAAVEGARAEDIAREEAVLRERRSSNQRRRLAMAAWVGTGVLAVAGIIYVLIWYWALYPVPPTVP